MEIGTWCSWGFWIGMLVAMNFSFNSSREARRAEIGKDSGNDFAARKSQARSKLYEQISCIAIGVMLFSALTWLGYSNGFSADAYP